MRKWMLGASLCLMSWLAMPSSALAVACTPTTPPNTQGTTQNSMLQLLQAMCTNNQLLATEATLGSLVTAAGRAVGATGAAVPPDAVYMGIISGGNLTGWNGTVNQGTPAAWVVDTGTTGNLLTAINSAIPPGTNAIGTVDATVGGALLSAIASPIPTQATSVPIGGVGLIASAALITGATRGATFPLDVQLRDASGNQITSFGSTLANAPVAAGTASATASVLSGCQYLSAAPTFTNTQQGSCIFDVNGRILTSLASGAPIAPATATATKSNLIGGQYNSTQATLTDGQQGSYQMSSRGELKIVHMDAAGNARGQNINASNQASVSLDGGTGASVRWWDGTNTAAVKGASTTPVAADPAGVVSISPNSAGLIALGGATPANSVPVVNAGFSFSNIATATTTTSKSGAGVLHSVCINTINATSTLQMYDNTAGSGTKIGLLTQATGQQPGCFIYDVAFSTGLTLVSTGGTPDYTVNYR